jgi:hypothetical protein
MRYPHTSLILHKWEPRIGSRGAQWFALAVWSRFVMLPLGVLLFLGLWFTTNQRSVASTVVVVVVSAAAFGNAALIWLAPVMARRAASAVLGINITKKNYPPNDPDSYLRWCRENGIAPNNASGVDVDGDSGGE